MATHEVASAEESLRAARGTMALDATEDGGLLAFGSDPHTLTVVPIDARGRRRGEARALTVRRLGPEVALQRVGERSLLMAAGRCEGGARICFFGFLLNARGETIGEPARTFHGPGAAAPLPLEGRAPDRIWMVGLDTSPSFFSRYWAASLAEVDGRGALGELEWRGAPPEAIDEATYMRSYLGAAAGDRLYMLVEWESMGAFRRPHGRGFEGALVASFRGAVRDIVVFEGEGHVLVEEPSGQLFTARLPALDPRTPLAAGDPLPPPFSGRVLVELARDGELRLRDSRGLPVGRAIPIGRDAEAVAFTGERLLVALSGDRPRIASVECGSDPRP